MHVRSPVLTYWRGRSFDGFDGSVWTPDPTSWLVDSRGPAGVVYKVSRSEYPGFGPVYTQAYFIEESVPRGVLYSGYSPLIASVPQPNGKVPELAPGTVYKVLSAIPGFATGSLEDALPRARIDDRYHRVPASLEGLRAVAQQITGEAYTDLERARRIVSYLDANYVVDDAAEDQLAFSSDQLDFLSSRLRGTSMDFATAAVMLVRSVGIPARLVTGFIPGAFDPLSGTHAVRAGDRHAWAEMYVGGVGWVPFDVTPAPAGLKIGGDGTNRSRLLRSLFRANYGEAVYGSINTSPESLARAISRAFGGDWLGVAAGVTLGIVVTAAGAFAVRRLLTGFLPRARRSGYPSLPGDGRRELLRLYSQTEDSLRAAGFGRRSLAQTLAEYAGPVERCIASAASDLVWLRRLAWAGAYDPGYRDSDLLSEGRERLARVRAALALRRHRSG